MGDLIIVRSPNAGADIRCVGVTTNTEEDSDQ
jgi:hypothetical protein